MNVGSDKFFDRRCVERHHAAGLKCIGFTLLELLVVISIMGLLMALLIPVLGRAIARAKSVACQNNMRQVSITFGFYMAEHKGFFPPSGPSSNARWVHQLAPYLDWTRDGYLCPVFHCSLTPRQAYQTSFGTGVYGYLKDSANQGYPVSKIKMPASTVVLAEKAPDTDTGAHLATSAPYPEHERGAAHNHDGVGHYLYADLHVEALKDWPGAEAFVNPDAL